MLNRKRESETEKRNIKIIIIIRIDKKFISRIASFWMETTNQMAEIKIYIKYIDKLCF